MSTKPNFLPVDLYHGTSTLFLDSIIQNGLGGVNPVIEWNILELSEEVYRLSEKHLKETDLYRISSVAFKQMTEQSINGKINYQHGDTYLTPSKRTAARYAIHKQYGSELLTYTIIFMKELKNLKISSINEALLCKNPKVFKLMEASPSPILIQVKNVQKSCLLSENGESPENNINQINEVMQKNRNYFDELLVQCNFRLKSPVQPTDLRFWLINVQISDFLIPKFNLYEIFSQSENLKLTVN